MAKRKRKQSSWWSRLPFFRPRSPKGRRRKPDPTVTARRVWTVLRIVAVVVILGGLAFGFVRLDRYVKSLPDLQRWGHLELYGLPAWVRTSPALQEVIRQTAGTNLPLVEETAEAIGRRLEALPWMYNVYVQTGSQTVKVRAGYRRPRAVVRRGEESWHLAWVGPPDVLYTPHQRRVLVMPALEIEGIPIVEITGFASRPPRPQGAVALWEAEEIISTVELVATLGRMDELNCPDQPLLDHIARIDVANFNGRKDPKQSHIVMYTTGGTEIRWGAAFGQAATYSESTEQEKIASLYTFYKKHGRIDGTVKYIDLRIAQILPPRPLEP